MELDDVLSELKDFKEHVHAYLFYIGYQPTDIENLLLDLEQKIREANEQAES